MMGLKEEQILKMRKPAFGDVRAPRQWYTTANHAMDERTFIQHPLDGCVLLSTREATEHDDSFEVFTLEGKPQIVDGILGLHVDDFIGGGEGVVRVQTSTRSSSTRCATSDRAWHR